MPIYLTVFAFGAIIGSFLNVCIYRIPIGKSIVTPPSSCPSCGNPVKPYDNIPVISWLLLGGKCRSCKAGISPRYPLVEALNGALWCAVFLRFEPDWTSAAIYAVLLSALVVITFIDLDHQIIPDSISIPGIPLGIILGSLFLSDPFMRGQLMGQSLGWISSAGGAALGFGLYYVIAVASRGGMGGGDIKLMAMLGGFLGWKGVLLTTFVGSLAGSVVGLGLVVFSGAGRKTKVPFGPFLALGGAVSIFYGQELLNWYLSHGWR